MFVIETSHFNLDHIYNSGQAPRWIKLKEGKYIIPHKDKALKIEQQRDRFDWTKYRLIMSCTEDDFYNIWFHYFDLRMDCLAENDRVKNLGGKFRIIANRGHGVHVLRQDFFEAYVLSKLISNLGFYKATEAMNEIAKAYGIEHKQSMKEVGRITWYEWPTPEIMLEKLNEEKNGYGNIRFFLKKLCNAIVNDGFDITKSDNELFRLFGMHDTTVFPLVKIESVIEKNFDCIPEEFADWYLYDIENKGLVYMYIIHHVINRPKEMTSSGIN